MMKNDQMPIELGSVIFYCFTSVLDRIIMEKQGKEYSEEIAKILDSHDSGFYFVVNFNYDYCVVPAKMIKQLGIPSGDQTEEVTACMNHYINSL